MQMFKRFVQEEEGLVTVEYAILLALIAAGTIVAVSTLGDWVTDQFEDVHTEVSTAGD